MPEIADGAAVVTARGGNAHDKASSPAVSQIEKNLLFQMTNLQMHKSSVCLTTIRDQLQAALPVIKENQ